MQTLRPLISVVIPTLNVENVLVGALVSLAAQTFKNFEVVIADGASSDGSLQIARAHADTLPALRIVSAKDNGVYEAINRGVSIASGDWVFVLGADDRIADAQTLNQVAKVLLLAQADLVYGDVRMGAKNPWVPVGGRYRGQTSLEQLTRDNICQQAIFYRKTLIDRFGPFLAHYRVCADWEYAIRAFTRAGVAWMDVVVCDYACTGISSSQRDEKFLSDLPWLLLRAVWQQPFDASLQGLRWRFHEFAEVERRHRRWRGFAACRGAWIWLGLITRLAPRQKPVV